MLKDRLSMIRLLLGLRPIFSPSLLALCVLWRQTKCLGGLSRPAVPGHGGSEDYTARETNQAEGLHVATQFSASVTCRGVFLIFTAFTLVQSVFGQDCAPVPPGLVGWWSGDGSASDIIGTNNNSTVVAPTGFVSGMVGQAFSFDGTIGPQPPSALNLTRFTVDAWIKPAALPNGAAMIVSKGVINPESINYIMSFRSLLRMRSRSISTTASIALSTPT